MSECHLYQSQMSYFLDSCARKIPGGAMIQNTVQELISTYGEVWIEIAFNDNSFENTCTMTNLCNNESECSGCAADCVSVDWRNSNTGYQIKTTATCNCNTCERTSQYRCAPGYWGTSSNGTSGCTRCPESGASAAGTTSQTGCYVTSGTDPNGDYSFTSNCYYK